MREDIKLKPFDQAKHEAGFQAIADEVDVKVLEQMIEIAKNYKEPGTPKEKAIELYNKMYDYSLFEEEAKRCALIAVDEVMQQILWDKAAVKYWKEVKQEIEKL